MDALALNNFHAMGQHKVTDFVPQLTTGTQPPSQGSILAPVADIIVPRQAIPGPPNGLPWMTHQNQNYPVTTFAPPPWVSIPSCSVNRIIPKVPPLGLSPTAPINTKVNTVPVRTLWLPAGV